MISFSTFMYDKIYSFLLLKLVNSENHKMLSERESSYYSK